MDNIEYTKKLLERLNDRMSEIVLAFYVFKTLRMSGSINKVGVKNADENAKILIQHRYFFTIIEEALTNFFIINLYKFFDKSNKKLSLDTLKKQLKKHQYIDKKEEEEINKIIKDNKKNIRKIKESRNTLLAHENIGKIIEGHFERAFPLLKEVELLINAVQKIFNILSVKFNEPETTWKLLKDKTEDNTKFLIKNLKIAKEVRIDRIKDKFLKNKKEG